MIQRETCQFSSVVLTRKKPSEEELCHTPPRTRRSVRMQIGVITLIQFRLEYNVSKVFNNH